MKNIKMASLPNFRMKERKKVIIFTNADWHFYNHLLPIALEAKNRGYKVKILTKIDKHRTLIEKAGLDVIFIPLQRSSINIFNEIKILLNIVKVLKKESPDIIHNITVKPVLYGTIAAFICKTRKVINTYLGMGYLFTSSKLSMRIIRIVMIIILRIIGRFKNAKYVVQNSDDKKLLSDLKLTKSTNIINQCSVGIDIKSFKKLPEPKGKIVFALVARMLVDKGVYEFIEAAKILHAEQINAEFWLVGSPDSQNKASISEDILRDNHKKGYIKYFGYCEDISKIWAGAHVAVLPSYREGLSRSLLEAGAYGRPIITTDAPGGRDLVQDKVNGLLVSVGDHAELADAMRTLALDPRLRKNLSDKMMQTITENYDASKIANRIVDLYY